MSKPGRKNNRRTNENHGGQHSNPPSEQPPPQPSIPSTGDPQLEPDRQGGEEARAETGINKIESRLRILATLAAIFGIPILIVQSCANLRQARAAERQMILDERAWVVPFDYSKTNGVYRVLFKNTGKTPALNVDVDIRSTMVENDVETAKWPTNPPGPYSGVLGPNIERHADTESGERSNGKYFFGRIWYDDIFGNHHWTEFCVYYSPTAQSEMDNCFYIMPVGNSTDDSNTNKPH